MAYLYGRDIKREEIQQSIGNMSQVAGAKVYCFDYGKSKGVRAIDVRTGSGFTFTVLPDKGMDIAYAEFCGKSLAWISKTGIVSSDYYEPQEKGFLRNFFGGLLTTCGLTQVGNPCEDSGEKLGLHGRISNTPAERFHIEKYWDADEYIINVKGQVRESFVFKENMVLTREIICKLGESKLYINDTVENQGYNETPFMILYHMNFGFPVISEDTKLMSSCPIIRIESKNAEANKEKKLCDRFQSPTKGYIHKSFFHSVPYKKEKVSLALINESMEFGLYISYSPKQLPYLTEWKMLGQQDYVVGIEPGNCIPEPEGRKGARDSGRLIVLRPGEVRKFSIEIGVLRDKDDIILYEEKYGNEKVC